MLETLRELCGGSFMPHGHCYLWDPRLVWLHVISDALIAFAYFSIPVIILRFVRNRRDVPFPRIFVMFGAFIVACGLTHLLEVVTVWLPAYWLAGGMKVLTAIVSLASALALFKVVPFAMQLPSPEQLNELNRRLRGMNDELEKRVADRTRQLETANAELRAEVEQRRSAENEVRRLNGELKHRFDEINALFAALPVGVGIAQDAACSRIQANPRLAQLLGLPDQANMSLSAPPSERPTNFRVTQNDRELAPEELPMQRCMREKRAVKGFEEVVVRSDGVRLELLVNAEPLFDEAGAARGCVATFQDITDLNRRESEKRMFDRKLQETQKLESLGVLAGGIAHDFNNLLTGILGGASLARAEVPAGSPAAEHLAHIERAADRAADLCRQMLAYSGRGRFVIESIDLSRLVDDLSGLLQLSVGKQVQIRFELPRGLPRIRADATQLRQVLMNLVLNASEALEEREGQIRVSTAVAEADALRLARLRSLEPLTPGTFILLEVSDTGCGMDAVTLSRIFDPFFSTKFTGRGLGLAAVLGIVRGHSGGLEVQSDIGQGTTFRILFPAEEGPEIEPVRPPKPTGVWRGEGCVLLVDDEEIVRVSTKRILELTGFTVETAVDGREAVERFRQNPDRYTAVLLDLTMPHMDGEEAFLQMHRVNPKVRVLLMSGYSEQETVARFAGKGLAGFLQKPFTIVSLRAKLREVLAGAADAAPEE